LPTPPLAAHCEGYSFLYAHFASLPGMSLSGSFVAEFEWCMFFCSASGPRFQSRDAFSSRGVRRREIFTGCHWREFKLNPFAMFSAYFHK
jgi:hypothetical protein